MALFPMYEYLTTLRDGISKALRIKGEMEIIGSSTMQAGAKTVNTTAVALRVGAANLTIRKKLHVKCIGGEAVYVGLSDVTVSTGYPIFPGQEKVFDAGSALTLFAIAAEDNQPIRIIEEA